LRADTSPSLVASMRATELPLPDSDRLPPSRPALSSSASVPGNSFGRLRPCACTFALLAITDLRASNRTWLRIWPPATLKSSGSRRSTPSSTNRCAVMASTGSLRVSTWLARSFTSASMPRILSSLKGMSGSTRGLACCCAASCFCSGEADSFRRSAGARR
jgi:hypothetical protein